MNYKRFIVFLLLITVLGMNAFGCKKQNDDPVEDEAQFTFVEMNTDEYGSTVDSLVATDALGRSIGEASVSQSQKDVGLFYFIWHGEVTMSGIYDISQMLQNDPDTLWDVNGSVDSPVSRFHYWGEPLYGYYDSDDPYVIKKHMELFIASSIDYLCFDLTNGALYIDTIKNIADEILRLQGQGWDPPRLTALIDVIDRQYGNVAPNVIKLYDELYSQEKYESVWYRSKEDGKPIIAIDTLQGQKVNLYNASKEVYDFFNIRNLLWPQSELNFFRPDMPWMDWTYPQSISNYGYTSVSIAQHTSENHVFSESINPLTSAEKYNENQGRGWDYEKGVNVKENVVRGTNLDAQWQTAINNENVKEVMVTGWNEWIAQKLCDYRGLTDRVQFVDCVDMEFSRDLEMMKGGYGDNFYLQNMLNTRLFKGQTDVAFRAGTGSPALDGQWQSGRVYHDVVGEVVERDYKDARNGTSSIYINKTNRNDVESVRMVNDNEYLYIQINLADNYVFDYSKDNNLNVLISVYGRAKGWNGCDYIVNRTACESGFSKTSLHPFTTDGKYGFGEATECDAYLNGKGFAVKIPLKSLGISNSENFTIDFKVVDNLSNPSDVTSYYLDGESAPAGRLNYRYHAGK